MAPNEPVEVELKLLLPEHARAALERHPALQAPCATAPETRQEHTVYFDTPLLSLAGKGLSLRVRRCGAARVQTLKSAGDGYTVAASRGEWEWRIDQDVPDLSCVAETPFGAEIAAEGASGLQTVFETDIRRLLANQLALVPRCTNNSFIHGELLKGQRESTVDPQPRGPDWMPITPKTGSLFHADSHLNLDRIANLSI